jgi:hypothetical protein
MYSFMKSRAYVLGVYIKQILRWKRSSYPYLSIDAFADLADVCIFPPKYRKRAPSESAIVNAKIIFCPSDRLDEFLYKYRGLIQPEVIISGNSDFEFKSLPSHLPTSVRMLLLQNSFISDNHKIFTLPIGVENLRLGVNGHPKLFRFTTIPPSARGRILFGPFSATHPIRAEIKERFINIPNTWKYLHSRISPRRYRKIIEEGFEFVACPRGNGVDTHRLWETIYRGRKALISQDDWSQSIPYLEPLVCTVGEWTLDEVRKASQKDLPDLDPRLIPELWMPFWRNLIFGYLD